MLRMIHAIHNNHSNKEIDFLLCPVNRQFALRETLIKLNFSLKDEILIEDKSRFYEILFVSSKQNDHSKVSAIGEKIWQADEASQKEVTKSYLNKTLNHYQKIRQSSTNNIDLIISAYKNVNL